MEDPTPRVLVYILRHDIRLSDNPIFYAASKHLQDKEQTLNAGMVLGNSTHVRDDPFLPDQEFPAFTHLLPVYVFPANQVETSGLLIDKDTKSPYPPAQSHVAGLWRTGHHRAKFMAEGLWDLKTRLENLDCGSGLQIRVGRPAEVVEDIIQWYTSERGTSRNKGDVVGVWMNAEEGTDEKEDEASVRRVTTERGVPLKIWDDEKYFIDECVCLERTIVWCP